MTAKDRFPRDLQYAKFSAYGFLKDLRFFDPFLILFFLAKGMTYFEIGSLYAIREIAVNILEIPTGVVADAMGRRRTMISSFIAYLISFAIFYFGSSFSLLVGAMIVFAFGDAFRTGTHKAMILTYLKLNGLERFKTDYYGHTRGWSQTGAAASSLIAATIVFYSGNYSSIFLFSMIPYVADLVLMMTYPKELDGNVVKFSVEAIRAQFKLIWRGLSDVVRSPTGLRTVLSVSIYGGFFKATKDFLQPIIAALAISLPLLTRYSDQQRESVFIGIVYSVLFILTATASRSADRIAKKFKNPVFAMDMELLAGLIAGIAIGTFYLFGLTFPAIILFFAIYIIHNMRKPVGIAAISEAISEDVLATILSVESQIESLSAALLAFILGSVATLAGGSVAVGILVISGALIILWPFLRMPRATESG
jgi:MFS family permease